MAHRRVGGGSLAEGLAAFSEEFSQVKPEDVGDLAERANADIFFPALDCTGE